VQEGENPDVEIIKNITRHSDFENIPPYVGRIDYKNPAFEDTSIALLVDMIPNVESAWEMTQSAIERFFDKVLSEKEMSGKSTMADSDLESTIGHFYLEMTELMGQRTAGCIMHWPPLRK
jgi:maltose alpha-D-glucosyltransferase / alpha-amylase